jgi:hypothetical protein
MHYFNAEAGAPPSEKNFIGTSDQKIQYKISSSIFSFLTTCLVQMTNEKKRSKGERHFSICPSMPIASSRSCRDGVWSCVQPIYLSGRNTTAITTTTLSWLIAHRSISRRLSFLWSFRMINLSEPQRQMVSEHLLCLSRWRRWFPPWVTIEWSIRRIPLRSIDASITLACQLVGRLIGYFWYVGAKGITEVSSLMEDDWALIGLVCVWAVGICEVCMLRCVVALVEIPACGLKIFALISAPIRFYQHEVYLCYFLQVIYVSLLSHGTRI